MPSMALLLGLHTGTLSRISLKPKHPLFSAHLGISTGPSIMQPTSLLNLPVGTDLHTYGKGLPLPFQNHLYKLICCTEPAWQASLLYFLLCCNAIQFPLQKKKKSQVHQPSMRSNAQIGLTSLITYDSSDLFLSSFLNIFLEFFSFHFLYVFYGVT